MNKQVTDITLVVDRSGSMEAIRSDAEGGVNAFIAQQAKEPGEAFLTLVQFDTEYEFIHRGAPIGKVPQFKLVPRGSTALLDAVGRAINETGARLAAMKEADRPGLVVCVIVTDGQENSSREFTKPQIKQMIEHQQSVYKWHFTFLGADANAFADAAALGIAATGAAQYTMRSMPAAYASTSQKLMRMRKQTSLGETVCNEFTEEEREQMRK